MPIETINDCMVAATTEGIIMMRAPASYEILTNERALRLAAWLVAIADGPAEETATMMADTTPRTRFVEFLERIRTAILEHPGCRVRAWL